MSHRMSHQLYSLLSSKMGTETIFIWPNSEKLIFVKYKSVVFLAKISSRQSLKKKKKKWKFSGEN